MAALNVDDIVSHSLVSRVTMKTSSIIAESE